MTSENNFHPSAQIYIIFLSSYAIINQFPVAEPLLHETENIHRNRIIG